MRAHVVLPPELVQEVDSLVGRRRRSAFLVEAVRDKLRVIRLQRASEAAAGSVSEAAVPDWGTAAASDAWVRELRGADAQRLRQIAER